MIIFKKVGLGTASKKNVGTGSGQIPDMSFWTSGPGWFNLPSGLIIQHGDSGTSGSSITFPIPFPSSVLTFVAMPRSALNTAFIGTIQEDSSKRTRTGTTVLGFNASGVSITTASYGWLAIGI